MSKSVFRRALQWGHSPVPAEYISNYSLLKFLKLRYQMLAVDQWIICKLKSSNDSSINRINTADSDSNFYMMTWGLSAQMCCPRPPPPGCGLNCQPQSAIMHAVTKPHAQTNTQSVSQSPKALFSHVYGPKSPESTRQNSLHFVRFLKVH